MGKTLSKAALAIILSKLAVFEDPNVKLEQYNLDSENTAEILWNAYLQGDIEDKIIMDMGCGTGIIGIGAIMLGAKKVYFVDIDGKTLEVLRKNISEVFNENETGNENEIDDKETKEKIVIINDDVNNIQRAGKSPKEASLELSKEMNIIKEDIDVIITNPPFGVKKKHADKEFLEKAFEISDKVYSIHKGESRGFIEKICEDKGFELTHCQKFEFPLKNTQAFHKRRIYRIECIWTRMIRKTT